MSRALGLTSLVTSRTSISVLRDSGIWLAADEVDDERGFEGEEDVEGCSFKQRSGSWSKAVKVDGKLTGRDSGEEL